LSLRVRTALILERSSNNRSDEFVNPFREDNFRDPIRAIAHQRPSFARDETATSLPRAVPQSLRDETEAERPRAPPIPAPRRDCAAISTKMTDCDDGGDPLSRGPQSERHRLILDRADAEPLRLGGLRIPAAQSGIPHGRGQKLTQAQTEDSPIPTAAPVLSKI
jgi:hypothetical protein